MADSRNRPFTEPVLQAVESCLRRHVCAAQSLVIGFSGGLDSTVLLHATSRLVETLDFSFSALHVHHGLSSKADTWENSCKHVCQKFRIPFVVRRVDVPLRGKEGIEAAARRLRHKVFEDYPANWIILAHHADDQAETILHNLLRGAGVRGAASMPEARGRVLRPMLGLARSELLAYALANRLEWIEDESNEDRQFTRNYLRHEVLPVISARFPKASEQLAAAASRFGEADALLNDLATLDLRGNPAKFPIDLMLIRELPESRARNLLRAMLTWNQVQAPDARRLNEFVRQLQTAGNDRHPRLELERYLLWSAGGMLCFKKTD